jgi:O-methyltransferase
VTFKRFASELVRSTGYRIVRTETLDRLVEEGRKAPRGKALPAFRKPQSTEAVLPHENEEPLSAEYYFRIGKRLRDHGMNDLAFANFARAISLIPRYGPARDVLIEMSNECLAQAESVDPDDKLLLLVRALEMNPLNSSARSLVETYLRNRNGEPDLTKMCFVFYDGDRARRIHEEAYKRALEFVTIGGIPGALMEFGVLGGWSSRIFCEILRDIFNLNNIYLFDSFEGLPEYHSAVDLESYEIAGRNIWADKMKFPADFVRQFEQPHEWHIRDRLSEIIRPERIIVRKGFYSDTLKNPPKENAAVVHIDCDLYQSTVEVLNGLYRGRCLQDGTVLLFDDWNCNKGNPNFGERRAFQEFVDSQKDYTATPWFTYGWCGAAYILHSC